MISHYCYRKLKDCAERIIASCETRTVYWINSRCSFSGDDDELIGAYSANRTLADLLSQMVEDFEEWVRVSPSRLDIVKRKPAQRQTGDPEDGK